MADRCGAHAGDRDGYPAAHTCDDPLLCALASLTDGGDPTQAELSRLHQVLDLVEELCSASKATVARDVLAVVHDERGGPR